MELTIDRLSKQYNNKIAVDRISLKLQKGSMVCWAPTARERQRLYG